MQFQEEVAELHAWIAASRRECAPLDATGGAERPLAERVRALQQAVERLERFRSDRRARLLEELVGRRAACERLVKRAARVPPLHLRAPRPEGSLDGVLVRALCAYRHPSVCLLNADDTAIKASAYQNTKIIL